MSADPAFLDPALRPLAERWLAEAKAAGLFARITFTYRTPAEQDALKAKGITALSGARSKHCCRAGGKPASRAFDFALFDEKGRYLTDGTDRRYRLAGEVAERLGLRWGGRFVRPRPDYDHIELL